MKEKLPNPVINNSVFNLSTKLKEIEKYRNSAHPESESYILHYDLLPLDSIQGKIYIDNTPTIPRIYIHKNNSEGIDLSAYYDQLTTGILKLSSTKKTQEQVIVKYKKMDFVVNDTYTFEIDILTKNTLKNGNVYIHFV